MILPKLKARMHRSSKNSARFAMRFAPSSKPMRLAAATRSRLAVNFQPSAARFHCRTEFRLDPEHFAKFHFGQFIAARNQIGIAEIQMRLDIIGVDSIRFGEM